MTQRALSAAGWTLLDDHLWQPPNHAGRRHTLTVAALLLKPPPSAGPAPALFAPKRAGRPRTRLAEEGVG